MESADGLFGPQLAGSFDFTLLFEHSILSIIPSALFIIAAVMRLLYLLPSHFGVKNGWLLWLKTIISSVLVCLQVAILTLWSLMETPYRALAVGASSLSLAASLLLGILMFTEHRRSIRPSVLLGGYLFLSVLLDLAQARSLFLRSGLTSIGVIFSTSVAAKLALLLLEELPKISTVSVPWKDAAPESVSGAMNRSVFWWLNDMLFLGYRRLIIFEDLSNIQKKFDSTILLSLIDRQWMKINQSQKHGLFLATMRALLFQTLIAVPPRLALTGFKFAQPFLIQRIIDFVGSSTQSQFDTEIARGLVGATAIIYVGIAVSTCLYLHLTYQLITRIRGALVGLIYKKTLCLPVYTDAAPITLMSTDIDGITAGFRMLHDIWASILELGIGIYLLYKEVGPASFLVFIPIVVSTFFSEKISVQIIPAKITWNQGVQERVSATSLMLGQMKSVKATGLAPAFSDLIQALRQEEIKKSKKFRTFLISLQVLVFVNLITPAIIITATVFWTGVDNSDGLSISKAFTSLTLVALVSTPLYELVATRAMFNGSLGCFRRIQDFLVLEDKQNHRFSVQVINSKDKIIPTSELEKLRDKTKTAEIQLLGATESQRNPMVKMEKAFFQARDKTVILYNIDLEVQESTFHVIIGPVGSGKTTLLHAILGELSLERGSSWSYQGSVAFCSQTPWLRNLSIRDNIVVGAEFDQDWYFRVVGACALEADFASIPDWDKALIGSGGLVLSGGQKQRVALARALYSRKRLLLLDDIFSGLDNKTGSYIFSQILGQKGLLKSPEYTVILTTSTFKFIPYADKITALEGSTTTSVSEEVKSIQLSALNSKSVDSEVEPDVLAPQEAENADGSELAMEPDHAGMEQDMTRQSGDSSLYRIYLSSVGFLIASVFIVSVIVMSGLAQIPQIWLRFWTEHGTNNNTAAYYSVYIAFTLAGVLAAVLGTQYFVSFFIPKSASKLHFTLLETVLKAPLQFFGSTDSGVTLNRFSQDMTLVDQQLPMAFFATILTFTDCIISAAIIATGAQYTAAYIPFILVLLYLLQKFYLRTSRQLRYLDLEAKSPLYTHFTETLAGGVTIRAFGWEACFIEESHRRLDASQRPFYLLFCIQRWLNLVLDFAVAGIAVVLVSSALLVPEGSTKGAIALSMFTLITFGSQLAGLITVWTILETSLGAIARLKSFLADTPKEDKDQERQTVPDGWPTQGAIKFEGVVVSYSDDHDPCLRNINLDIKPGSKVALCGRTGSGKSSALLALLRLIELKSGTIHIDGIDLSMIPRQTIRSLVTALPQDPVTVPGSIRANLDPLNRYTGADEGVVAALQKVRLWDVVREKGGLDSDFAAASFSTGQKQLFSLARCLLYRGKVVLLDEVTSSVDGPTERIIREVLKRELADCTVVEVLHRLDSILDYDEVVVMQDGIVAEVGRPVDLLETDSLFKEIWDAGYARRD